MRCRRDFKLGFFTRLTTSAPQLTASAPQLTTSAPQLTASAPQLTASAPQLTTSAPQLTASAPQLTASVSQLTASVSQLTASASQLTASASQLTASVSQLSYPCCPTLTIVFPLMGIVPLLTLQFFQWITNINTPLSNGLDHNRAHAYGDVFANLNALFDNCV
jgi:uncharacterized phage infection (PIP) family protein YhgE